MTEREFCRDLKLTWQAFGLDTPEVLEQRQVDVQGLFGNLSDVIEVSSQFLETLSDHQEGIGQSFLTHAESMKKVYTDYCINHDKGKKLDLRCLKKIKLVLNMVIIPVINNISYFFPLQLNNY